ncbi:MAG: ATP-binding cassette domain-containing protein [Ligilactobacillus ruminis]
MSIKAGKGKVFGILGANGAGKSTIIECMLGTKTADSGSVSILGCDPKKDRRTLFQKVGVQFLANLEENFNVPTFPIEANDFIFL